MYLQIFTSIQHDVLICAVCLIDALHMERITRTRAFSMQKTQINAISTIRIKLGYVGLM